ncbi:MAG: hypothetical protein H0V29_06615, partial [Thermoleophilaceae bacterium]|nr:hypothetical protein [Thermoleophilaceae bacterium]
IPPTASPLALRQRPGGTVPLLSPQRPVEDLPAIERTVTDRFGGTATFKASGTLGKGKFSAELKSFSEDGAVSFTGALAFETTETGFTHSADILRVRATEDDEGRSAGFYRASLSVAGDAATGELHSKAPRRGEMRAAAAGGRLVPQDGWKAGRRKASGVVGVAGCKPKKKRRKRKKSKAKKR